MDLTPGAALAADFRQACFDFDFKHESKINILLDTLDLTTEALAQSEQIRIQAGDDPTLWKDLRKLWRDLARAQLSFWDNDDSDNEGEEDGKDKILRTVCFSLAKFTRNIVAGIPANQVRAFDSEPDIRRLLHYFTSWSAMEDSESVATARVLTQALSNTVTANDTLVARLWETYLHLPEDQVVLIRLLGSSDPKTLLTTLIFILNCIHGSPKRTQLLTKSKVGVRVCIGLLDNMVQLHEAENGSEAAKAFDIGYAIFTQFIEGGFISGLYKRFTIANEIITPHQTTLLKLVDSYLQSSQMEDANIDISDMLQTHENLGPFLAKRFFMLSTYAQKSIRRALGIPPPPTSQQSDGNNEDPEARACSDSTSSSSPPRSGGSTSSDSGSPPLTLPGQVDVMLPKVCEALVLITQCIVTISLEAEDQQKRVEEGTSSIASFTNMKRYFTMKKFADQGVVENLIELLRLLDLFLPRINFGKPVGNSASNVPSPAEGAGFSYLKRDLVRLLGVLCHEMKDVQDRTRETGGIPVVMNLCVVDERNPYLREHAIFTLHNLLKNNSENQKVVDGIKPSQEWNKDGTLQTNVGNILK